MERLDNFSKILLATQTINYFASMVNGVLLQQGISTNEIIVESANRHNAQLAEMLNAMIPIIENIGNYVNGCDCISPIDVRITTDAMNILLHGKDDVNK